MNVMIAVASLALVGVVVIYSVSLRGGFLPGHPTATNTTAPRTPAQWSLASSINQGSIPGELQSVAVWNASLAWVVGTTSDAGIGKSSVIEQWNGTAWSGVPSVNPGDANELKGVALVDATDAWTVGDCVTTNPKTRSSRYVALIERWDGVRWSVVPSPSPGVRDVTLSSVAVINASFAWAVGSYEDAQSRVHTLIEQWDGVRWSVVPSPSPGSAYNDLDGVAALDASHAWAVGTSSNDPRRFTSHSLIEQWNGSSWLEAQSPSGSAAANGLLSVAVLDATHAWAVGYALNIETDTGATLIEQWNGAVWSIVPNPNSSPNYHYIFLNSIAVFDTSHAWAVGYYESASQPYHTSFIEQWNGKAWSIVSNPNPGSWQNYLIGVAIVDASHAWAVGSTEDDGPEGVQTLIEEYK
jgi:hypothetical protein